MSSAIGWESGEMELEECVAEERFSHASVVLAQPRECGNIVALAPGLFIVCSGPDAVHVSRTGAGSTATVYSRSKAVLRLGAERGATCAVRVPAEPGRGDTVCVALGAADGRVRRAHFAATQRGAQLELSEGSADTARYAPQIDGPLPVRHAARATIASQPASSGTSGLGAKAARCAVHGVALIAPRSASEAATLFSVAVDGEVHAWRRSTAPQKEARHATQSWYIAYHNQTRAKWRREAALASLATEMPTLALGSLQESRVRSNGTRSPSGDRGIGSARGRGSGSEYGGLILLAVSEKSEHFGGDRGREPWRRAHAPPARGARPGGAYWADRPFPPEGLYDTRIVLFSSEGRITSFELDSIHSSDNLREGDPEPGPGPGPGAGDAATGSARVGRNRRVLALAASAPPRGSGDVAVVACAHGGGAISRWRLVAPQARRSARGAGRNAAQEHPLSPSASRSSAWHRSLTLQPFPSAGAESDLTAHVGDVSALRFVRGDSSGARRGTNGARAASSDSASSSASAASSLLLVSGGVDGVLRVWRFVDGVVVRTVAGLWRARITSIDWEAASR